MDLRRACASTTNPAINESPVGPRALGVASGSVLAGQLAAAQGDCATALREWQLVVESDARKARLARFELGRGLLSLGDTPGAVGQFRLAGAGYHIYALGLSRQESGQAAEAQSLFELAFAVEPSVLTAEPLAQRLVEAGQIERAAAIWLQLADSTGEREANHWLALAQAATLRQDWAQTGAALAEAFQVADDPYPILLRLGRARMKQADWPGAIVAYEQAIQLQPQASSEPYSQAGLANANLGRYAEAMAWFDQGVAAARQDPWPNIWAGQVAEQAGALVEAERRLLLAVDMAPGHFGAQQALGLLYLRHGRFREAALALEPIASDQACDVLSALQSAYLGLGDAANWERLSEQLDAACSAPANP